MKVILTREVDHLGLAGDVVEVADGYGRNFLLPRGMAILATTGAMKQAEGLLRSRKAQEAKTFAGAEAAKDALESRSLRILARVDDRGGLYGSVNVAEIYRVLKERGHAIERKRIVLRAPIKEIGSYEVEVRVHPQVTAVVSVEVADEEGKVTQVGGNVEAPAPLNTDATAPDMDTTDVLVAEAIAAVEAVESDAASDTSKATVNE
ncbi:MAG: 50S ribosomal protein L9 [Nitriliruptoraceae bacterium]